MVVQRTPMLPMPAIGAVVATATDDEVVSEEKPNMRLKARLKLALHNGYSMGLRVEFT